MKKQLAVIIGILAILQVGACASTLPAESEIETEIPHAPPVATSLDNDLVATDFVSVIAQLPGMMPSQTILSVRLLSSEDEAFGRALQNSLLKTGYGVRNYGAANVDADIAFKVSMESITSPQITGVQAVAYEVKIGESGLRRSYEIDEEGRIVPLGPMQARGFDTANLVLDDSVFYTTIEPSAGDEEPLKSASAAGAISRWTAMSARSGSTDGPLFIGAESNDPFSASGSIKPVEIDVSVPRFSPENFKDSAQSSFAGLLTNFAPHDKQTFAFPNDSTDLGSQEIGGIRDMVGGYNVETDVIVVIGCSHGGGGNPAVQKSLAQARAKEAKRALEILGLPADKIFVEASWSAERYDEVLPRRAAVITLWRQKPQASS